MGNFGRDAARARVVGLFRRLVLLLLLALACATREISRFRSNLDTGQCFEEPVRPLRLVSTLHRHRLEHSPNSTELFQNSSDAAPSRRSRPPRARSCEFSTELSSPEFQRNLNETPNSGKGAIKIGRRRECFFCVFFGGGSGVGYKKENAVAKRGRSGREVEVRPAVDADSQHAAFRLRFQYGIYSNVEYSDLESLWEFPDFGGDFLHARCGRVSLSLREETNRRGALCGSAATRWLTETRQPPTTRPFPFTTCPPHRIDVAFHCSSQRSFQHISDLDFGEFQRVLSVSFYITQRYRPKPDTSSPTLKHQRIV